MASGDSACLLKSQQWIVHKLQSCDERHSVEEIIRIRKVFGKPPVQTDLGGHGLAGYIQHFRRRVKPGNLVAHPRKPLQKNPGSTADFKHPLCGKWRP
jgi:hypothetical protein